jgi:hypothetical protein
MIFANLGSRKFTTPNYIYDRKNALLSPYMNVSARDLFLHRKTIVAIIREKYIKKGKSRDQSHHRGGVGKISPVG